MKNILVVTACLVIFSLLTGCATVEGDWRETQKRDSIYAYQHFLRKHPHSKFSDDAKKKIEELAWSYAKKQNTKASYLRFINAYPGSVFVTQAHTTIEAIDWESARKANSLKGYRQFLEKYPNGQNASAATEAIAHLKNEEENKAYLHVTKSTIRAELETFLKLYPTSKHKDHVQRRISMFTTRVLSKPRVYAYSDFGLKPPMSGEEAAKKIPSHMGVNFIGPVSGSTLALRDDIYVLHNDATLPRYSGRIVPTKILATPRNGGDLVEITTMGPLGVVIFNFKTLVAVGTEISVPQNQWIHWGKVEFRNGRLRFLQNGIELSGGAEITSITR